MTISNQSVIDLARETLNDDTKVRWTDAECLKYLKDALDAVYKIRPDLFYGDYSFDSTTLTLDGDNDETYDADTDLFPINVNRRREVADYIIMRCETKDDEAVNNNRAVLAIEYFKEQLGG